MQLQVDVLEALAARVSACGCGCILATARSLTPRLPLPRGAARELIPLDLQPILPGIRHGAVTRHFHRAAGYARGVDVGRHRASGGACQRRGEDREGGQLRMGRP